MTLKELLMKMPDSDNYVILDVKYDHDDGGVTQFTYLGMPVTVTFLKHFINKDFYNKTVEYLTYNPKGITHYMSEKTSRCKYIHNNRTLRRKEMEKIINSTAYGIMVKSKANPNIIALSWLDAISLCNTLKSLKTIARDRARIAYEENNEKANAIIYFADKAETYEKLIENILDEYAEVKNHAKQD